MESVKSQTKNSELYSRSKRSHQYTEQINMMKIIFQKEFYDVYRIRKGDAVQDAGRKDQLRVLKLWFGYEVIRPELFQFFNFKLPGPTCKASRPFMKTLYFFQTGRIELVRIISFSYFRLLYSSIFLPISNHDLLTSLQKTNP